MFNTTQLKREEYNIEIRKNKRNEKLKKIRNQKTLAIHSKLKQHIDSCLNKTYQPSDLSQLFKFASSDDLLKQYCGVIGIRKLVSCPTELHIQQVIDGNMVIFLIKHMQNHDEPYLQYEATWALSNLASGTTQQTWSIINKGGIIQLINLLKSNNMEIAEQAIWGISNIASDNHEFRDIILKYNGLDPLIELVNKKLVEKKHIHENLIETNVTDDVITLGVWAISNICRGKPVPDLEKVKKAIPTLCEAIKNVDDVETLTNAGWSLSYLSSTCETAMTIVKTQIIPILVDLLYHNDLAIVMAYIRTIGNIQLFFSDIIYDVPNLLSILYKLLHHNKKGVKRETCWLLSNITGGNSKNIQSIMGDPKYVQKIFELTKSEFDEVAVQATWVLKNATTHCSIEQLIIMAEQGIIDCFIHLLDSVNSEIVSLSLEALWNISNHGATNASEMNNKTNKFLDEIESKGGVEKIAALQLHANHEIYEKSVGLLERHFDLDTDHLL